MCRGKSWPVGRWWGTVCAQKTKARKPGVGGGLLRAGSHGGGRVSRHTGYARSGKGSSRRQPLPPPSCNSRQKPWRGLGLGRARGAGRASAVPRPLARTIPFFCKTKVEPFTRLETTATLKPSETAAGPGLGAPPSPAAAAPTIIPTPGRCYRHEAPRAARRCRLLSSLPQAGLEPAAALRDPPRATSSSHRAGFCCCGRRRRELSALWHRNSRSRLEAPHALNPGGLERQGERAGP